MIFPSYFPSNLPPTPTLHKIVNYFLQASNVIHFHHNKIIPLPFAINAKGFIIWLERIFFFITIKKYKKSGACGIFVFGIKLNLCQLTVIDGHDQHCCMLKLFCHFAYALGHYKSCFWIELTFRLKKKSTFSKYKPISHFTMLCRDVRNKHLQNTYSKTC